MIPAMIPPNAAILTAMTGSEPVDFLSGDVCDGSETDVVSMDTAWIAVVWISDLSSDWNSCVLAEVTKLSSTVSEIMIVSVATLIVVSATLGGFRVCFVDVLSELVTVAYSVFVIKSFDLVSATVVCGTS